MIEAYAVYDAGDAPISVFLGTFDSAEAALEAAEARDTSGDDDAPHEIESHADGVPNLYGMTEEEWMHALRAAGFRLGGYAYHDYAEIETVMVREKTS